MRRKLISGLLCIFVLFGFLYYVGKATQSTENTRAVENTQATESKTPRIEISKDLKYSWLIEPKYKWCHRFSEELWAVQREDGLWGYVNSADNVVFEFQYRDVVPFKNGLAFVHTNSEVSIDADGKSRERKFWGLIDKTGRYLIEPHLELNVGISYDVATYSFVAFRSAEGKYGFVNLSGDVQISAVYDGIKRDRAFFEGKVAVKSGDLWGVVNTKGEWIVPPIYGNLLYYLKGHIPFQAEEEKLWGFLNAQGEVVLKPTYTYVMSSAEGEGPWVVYLDDKKGALDENLAVVIAPQYKQGRYSSGIGLTNYIGGLVFMDDSGIYRAMDTEGKELFAFPSFFAVPITGVDGYYALRGMKNQVFLVNKSGEMLLPPEFEDLDPSAEGIISAKKDGLWGLIKAEQ